jgi:hypothetical protein
VDKKNNRRRSIMSRENPSYAECCEDYSLWGEFVDTGNVDTEEFFESRTFEEKYQMMVDCFGEEEE